MGRAASTTVATKGVKPNTAVTKTKTPGNDDESDEEVDEDQPAIGKGSPRALTACLENAKFAEPSWQSNPNFRHVYWDFRDGTTNGDVQPLPKAAKQISEMDE